MYKTINLIKIQRSNERVLQHKASRFERHKDTPRLRVDAHFFFLKSPLLKISGYVSRRNLKQAVHKFVAFLTGVEGWLNVKQTAKNTLVLTKISRRA